MGPYATHIGGGPRRKKKPCTPITQDNLPPLLPIPISYWCRRASPSSTGPSCTLSWGKKGTIFVLNIILFLFNDSKILFTLPRRRAGIPRGRIQCPRKYLQEKIDKIVFFCGSVLIKCGFVMLLVDSGGDDLDTDPFSTSGAEQEVLSNPGK